jgi:hypothetical protein
MRLFYTAITCAAVLTTAPVLAQQIQTGTPRGTNAAPSVTNQGSAQPADTNPSTERMTGTAGSKTEQAQSNDQGMTRRQGRGTQADNK